MKRSCINYLVYAMLFCIIFISPDACIAQNSSVDKLTAVLPNDVFAFVATSGADELKPAFEKTILNKLWKDPGVQTFYKSIYDGLVGKIKQEAGDPNEGKAIDIVLSFAKLIKTRPLIIGAAQKEATEGPPVYGFAILNAGERKAEIASALAKLEGMADEGDIVDVKIGAVTLHGPKNDNDVPGYWGWIGNYLVFAINDGQGLAIKNIQSRNSSTASYLNKVPANNDALAIHINPEKVLNLVRTIAKAEGDEEEFAKIEGVIKELGVDKVKTLNTRIGFDGPDLIVNELIEIPAPRTGLFACFKTIDLKMFDMVDARAMNATAFNCDVAGIYDTVLKAIKTAAGEDFNDVKEEIAEMEKDLEFKIRDGLLESLDGRIMFYVLPGGIMPQSPQDGFILVAKLKNAQLWEQTLATLGKFASEESDGMVQVSSQEQDGRTIHTWAVMPLAMAQVMPCWAISDDKVVIASNPAMCNLAIDQIKTGGKSIRTTKGFKKVTAKLPDNLLSLKYVDSKVQFNQTMMGIQQFWPMATMFATKAGLKLPFVLPSLTHIAEDMGPSCQYSWFDDQGLRSHYRGVGIEESIGIVAGTAVGLGVAMPALARAKSQAKRTVSMSNLKQLTLATIMYADDNDGNFPENFDQIKEYAGDSKVLESPMKPKDFNGPSYIYVQGHSNKAGTSPAKDIIIYENPAYCNERINVAFLDGHIEQMQRDRFLEILKETYQRLGREMPEIKFKD